jgi:hypothetical protein
MLRALMEGTRVAHAYAARLQELELIEPVRIEIDLIDGSEVKLEGLYGVEPDALRRLSGDALQSMQAQGYLELAWYQAGSLAHVQGLIARKNRRLNAKGL